jgi:hypothetical protein
MSHKHKQRGRKDHYTPQGYLRGFVDPSRTECDKALWHLDLASNEWREKSPAEVGWEKGFYDYAGNASGLEHPDVTFAKFEREFPPLRERMIQRRFKSWVKQQKPFLLGYMQMMRARSPLFFEQQTAHYKSLRGATVVSVGPGNQVGLDSLEMRPLPVNAVRNGVISQMRQEIEAGSKWMSNFNWCLRYAVSPDHSFVTGPQPLVLEGPAPDVLSAISHPDTLIWFPLCWQACLVGSLRRFNEGTDRADPWVLDHVREMFMRPKTGYLISAQPFPSARVIENSCES